MEQWIQTVIQNIYKEIPKVPMVVEATMEEQVSRIGEVIKGFLPRLKTWNHTMLGNPLEEKEKRKGQ
jgi:hypothetical protein